MSKFHIDINYPVGDFDTSVGWIYVIFQVDDVECKIEVSDVFNPHFDLPDIFIGLMLGYLPQEITIDEEGELKDIALLPVNDKLVKLIIKDTDYGESYDDDETEYPKVYIDAELDKHLLITTFMDALLEFLNERHDTARWRVENIKNYYLQRVIKYYDEYQAQKAI